MKVRVIGNFRDKDDYNREYQIGEECEFEETRALDLSTLGLVEAVSDTETSENTNTPKRGRKSAKQTTL